MRENANEVKYQRWLDTGLVTQEEYATFRQIMDEYNPQNKQENRLAYLEFLHVIGDITKQE